jgi:hypothetical protein
MISFASAKNTKRIKNDLLLIFLYDNVANFDEKGLYIQVTFFDEKGLVEIFLISFCYVIHLGRHNLIYSTMKGLSGMSDKI